MIEKSQQSRIELVQYLSFRFCDVYAVTEVENDVLDHLQVVVVASEVLEVLPDFVEGPEDVASDVDCLVHRSVLKQLETEVGTTQGNAAFLTSSRT